MIKELFDYIEIWRRLCRFTNRSINQSVTGKGVLESDALINLQLCWACSLELISQLIN